MPATAISRPVAAFLAGGRAWAHTMTYVNLWRCKECGWKGEDSEMLLAQHPFDESTTITGCPVCKAAEPFEQLCDSCEQVAGCGWPTPDGGYRRTCGKHMRESDEPRS